VNLKKSSIQILRIVPNLPPKILTENQKSRSQAANHKVLSSATRAISAKLLQQIRSAEELIAACRESLRVDPGNPDTHFTLGLVLAAQTGGDEEEARDHLRTAARLAPASVPTLNSVAWILATHASPQVRDGELAIQLAGKACQLTQNRSVMPLLALAAAQAETGRYDEAVSTALLGQKLAAEAGQSQLAAQCGNFASWYQSRRPFRQPASP